MKKQTVILVLAAVLFSPAGFAEVGDDEIRALRDQVQMLTRRLDALEKSNQQTSQAVTELDQATTARVDEAVESKVEPFVTEQIDERMAGVSWAERMRWKGDFRYRYENIDEEGKDGRNRSRIRARTHLEADLSPTLEVGIGLATGGDDPVSSNQTIGGGGSSKDIKIDLAYFEWTGLSNTSITGGKYSNFLVRPGKKGLRWDGDWRPEGLGLIWDNDMFFVQGLGTWLEGDSRNGTEFAWGVQGGMKIKTGDSGKLRFGVGYTVFDIAGRTPLFGDPDDFYGNSFIPDPNGPSNPNGPDYNLVFAHNYRNYEAFADWTFMLGNYPLQIFGTTPSTRKLMKTIQATSWAPSLVLPRREEPGISAISTRNSKPMQPWACYLIPISAAAAPMRKDMCFRELTPFTRPGISRPPTSLTRSSWPPVIPGTTTA